MRLLTDFHHSALLRSTNLLFRDRLEWQVFRPIGMDWFQHDLFWHDSPDTAAQFLSLRQVPEDQTAALCEGREVFSGWFEIFDPGLESMHLAVSYDYAEETDWDLIMLSFPSMHYWQRWIEWRNLFHPTTPLVLQTGNEMGIPRWTEIAGVLASIQPRNVHPDYNVCFYHQEFDAVFQPRPQQLGRSSMSTFVNVLHEKPQAWQDFIDLQAYMPSWDVRSYGGQCKNGSLAGPSAVAAAMSDANVILHSKDGGDGYGHVIHSAYASGRPVVIRKSQYYGQLASALFRDGTCFDLDEWGTAALAGYLMSLPGEAYEEMGTAARAAFDAAVSFEADAEAVRQWLERVVGTG